MDPQRSISKQLAVFEKSMPADSDGKFFGCDQGMLSHGEEGGFVLKLGNHCLQRGII